MAPRLGYTIIYVEDIRAAAQFYRDAFGFAVTLVDERTGWAMVDAGGHALGFSSYSLMGRFFPSGFRPIVPDALPPGFELDVVVDDVDELELVLARAVAAGAVPVEPPRVADDGATVAFVRDPNGVIVEIQTPYQGPAGTGTGAPTAS
jgi:lactoylglutathione lyase